MHHSRLIFQIGMPRFEPGAAGRRMQKLPQCRVDPRCQWMSLLQYHNKILTDGQKYGTVNKSIRARASFSPKAKGPGPKLGLF